MRVDNYQALVKGKGVHCEVESEVSLRQNIGSKNMNYIRHDYLGWVCKTKQSPKVIQKDIL